MRVLTPRLLAVLDPEAQAPKARRPTHPTPGSGSARSTGSEQPRRGSNSGVPSLATPVRSTPSLPAVGPKDSDSEECSPFDLLHTERGFAAFEQWYRRLLATSPAANAAPAPRAELGLFWPQAYCPPNALHEHAFVELVRGFAECTESEALDLFDLLDHDFHGVLALHQVYIAICLLAALGCRQLTKFMYFHSTRLFGILSRGCRFETAPERVTWARLLTFFRLLGTPGHLLSRACVEHDLAPLVQLKYDDFLDVVFPIVVQLDRGGDLHEITVINETDRSAAIKSKVCTIL